MKQLFCSLLAISYLVLLVPEPVSAASQSNIIFILCDDLGWGDLGTFYQNASTHPKKHVTPQLDRMALEGIQLRAHYCPAPVCAPSRASLLTGVHQGHAEVRDNQFDKMLEENHTLASVLGQAGYTTALIGKYGLNGLGHDPVSWTSYPTKRGFQEFFGYVSHYDGHIHYPADHWPLGNSEGHRTPKKLYHNEKEISAALSKCYTTDLFTAKAKHWIQNQVETESEKPFFLYLAYDTPHAALQVPSVAYPKGSGVDGGVQWLGEPGKMINTAVGEIDSYRHPDYIEKGWTDQEERFATMVRRIDNCVGDLLQTLRDLEIDQETLVVLTSDNGPHHESYLDGKEYDPTSFQSYGPFEGTKRDTWEGGIRMPTLAWWPGAIPAGGIDEEPSQFHDWLATFCDSANVMTPARCDGVSLLPALKGQGKRRASTIYVEYWQNGVTKPYSDFSASKRKRKRGQMQVVHVDGYKGVRTDIQSHDTPFKIFDLKNDPKELNDLAGTSSEFEALQSRMKDQVLRLRNPNSSATRPYDNEFVPAVASGKNLASGVTWSSYQSDSDYVPQTQALESLSQGVARTIEAIPTDLPGNVVTLRGYLRVPKDDTYSLVLATELGAFVRIHQVSVVDADFGYEPFSEASGSIRLAKGLHPFSVTVRKLPSKPLKLDLRLSPSGVAPRNLAANQLFYSKN